MVALNAKPLTRLYSPPDAEMSEMKTMLDSLVSANDEKVRLKKEKKEITLCERHNSTLYLCRQEQRIKELESAQVLEKIKGRKHLKC